MSAGSVLAVASTGFVVFVSVVEAVLVALVSEVVVVFVSVVVAAGSSPS